MNYNTRKDCNKHVIKIDKDNPSNFMEFGNNVGIDLGTIHNSENTTKSSTILNVTSISNNGLKYQVEIVGDFLNVPLNGSQNLTNGMEGVIYYDTSNTETPIRPYTFFRIATVPTTDTINTSFEILIIDNKKHITEIWGNPINLGVPHIDDELSWPLDFQNIYNNNVVVCNVGASSGGTNNIRFKWQDHSNASVYYRVIYKKFSEAVNDTDVWEETDLIEPKSGIYQSYDLSGLDIGEKYEWSVMSYYSRDLKNFSVYYLPTKEFVFS